MCRMKCAAEDDPATRVLTAVDVLDRLPDSNVRCSDDGPDRYTPSPDDQLGRRPPWN